MVTLTRTIPALPIRDAVAAVSIPALVVWLALAIAAAGTFARRRWGGPQ
jgi:hypothetical protein